jgi:hypothetical protein
MPLESLFQLVGKLADRIQCYSTALRQSEMLTRYVLIDPLLRELGWDTENPDQVMPEYACGSGRVDYALISADRPIVKLEAKKLDLSLQEGLGQNINYCLVDGTPYFAVTDGRRWEIYETQKPVPISGKLVVGFDLAVPSPADVVFQALALWRPNIETGRVQLPQAPVVQPAEPTILPLKGDEEPHDQSAPLAPQSYAGKSITRFTFLGKQYPVSGWKGLLVTLATALYEADNSGFAKAEGLTGRSRIYFSTNPSQMRAPAKVGSSGYYVETHWSADNTVALCGRLLQRFGYSRHDLHIETR